MHSARGLIVFWMLGAAWTSAGEVFYAEDFDALGDRLGPAVDEAFPPELLGWTEAPPEGWAVDNSRMAMDSGVTEWRGWRFATMPFWTRTQAQGREAFVRARGVFAVADSDEYDDKGGPPAFDSTLIAPPVSIPADTKAYVSWDNMSRAVEDSLATLSASIDGGPDVVLAEYGRRSLESVRVSVEVAPAAAGRAWTLQLKWRHRAKNGWFWCIDNLRIADAPPPPPPPLEPLAGPQDWPAYRGDVSRRAVGPALPETLELSWTRRSVHPPAPAWPPPARADVWHEVAQLSPTTAFDRVFDVAVCDGRLFYGSSVDDTLYCLDADTGAALWDFTAEGPIRLAPAVTQGRVYFGADDGYAYCLEAATGGLIWRHRAGPEDRRLPGNGRMISMWPVRSGVVVHGGRAYFAAGVFPLQGAYLCAVNAADGAPVWRHEIDVPPQGYLLASPTRLFVPTGRTPPAAYDLETGVRLGGVAGLGHGDTGGCFALALEDALVHGASERGNLHVSDARTGERLISTPGQRLVAEGGLAYILDEQTVTAVDLGKQLAATREIASIHAQKERDAAQRKRLRDLTKARDACLLWKRDVGPAFELALAGPRLAVGGRDRVTMLDAASGAPVWEAAVDGAAYGLAVADGRLYVSTNQGVVHCFAAGAQTEAREWSGERASLTLDPLHDEMAVALAGNTGIAQGYCLVLNAGEGGLAAAIAARTGLRVIGVEADADRVAEGRRRLRAAGLYGARVVLHHVPEGALPYPPYFANLVTSAGALDTGAAPAVSPEELWRVVQPCGGLVALAGPSIEALRAWDPALAAPGEWPAVKGAWGVRRRARLEGAGNWTHTYAEPGNSACSGDVRVTMPLRMQWFGAPGPRRMVDRHFRNVPPLYDSGRLFIPGENIVYAVDAYNGAALWQRELPGTLRMGVFLDASNLCLDGRRLYVAAGTECLRLDVKTGAPDAPFALPAGDGANGAREWGYVARVGDVLLGSRRAQGATYNVMTKDAQRATTPVWYPNMKIAVSEAVFALDAHTGAMKWTYVGGRIAETTLAAAGGRVYFLESHSAAALADVSGRLRTRDFTADGAQHLVAIGADSGAVAYKTPVEVPELQQICYINCAHGVVLLSGGRILNGDDVTHSGDRATDELSGDEVVHYDYFAFDAATGAPLWRAGHDTGLNPDGGHGEYNRHPTIIGETVYAWPYAYDLKTGVRDAAWRFDRRGHGCGGVSASAHGLYWRGGNPWMYDLRPGKGACRLTSATRPGCWINILPVGGLVLIPAHDAGCTCAFPIQATLAFAAQGAR